MDIIKSIEHEQLKNKIPDLKVGNTVSKVPYSAALSGVNRRLKILPCVSARPELPKQHRLSLRLPLHRLRLWQR